MPLTPPPNTFTWPAKRGPLSKNIKDPQCWQDEGILVPHEMFRWYFVEIRAMLRCIDGSVPWKVKLFATWIEPYVLDAIHHHHESEEKIYNPMIKEKGGNIIPSLESDHTSLMEGIGKAKALLPAMKLGQKQSLAQFKELFEKWMQDCEKHFDMEEQQYPEQLKRANISQEEEAATVGKILQSLGLEGNKTMLPAICYAVCLWGGEEKMQQFFDNGPPPPIQFLAKKCWINDFWVNNLRVIEAIKSGTESEYVPEPPQCGCTIS